MNKFFVRVFFDNTYVTYYGSDVIEIVMNNHSCVKSQLRVTLKGRKVLTSLPELSTIDVGKYYYIFVYNVIIRVGIVIPVQHIILDSLNFKKVFNTDCEIEFNCKENSVQFSQPIYIGYTKYNSGKYYYCKETVFCVNGIEFTVSNDTLLLIEYIENLNKIKKYIKWPEIYQCRQKRKFDTKFKFEEQYLKFDEVIWKYIVTPVVTLVTMGTISVLTKRQGMLYFMLASVLATTITSLLTYYMQKRKVKYHNKMVDCNFEKSANKFLYDWCEQLQEMKRVTTYELIKQEPFVIGYLSHHKTNIEFDIKEEELSEQFQEKLCKLPSTFERASIAPEEFEVSLYGKYSNVYLNNLLYQLCVNNLVKHIVVLGDVVLLNSLKWLAEITYISNPTEMSYHSCNNKTLFIVSKQHSYYNLPIKSNVIGVVFYFRNYNCKNVIKLNNARVNMLEKLHGTTSSASLFTLMEHNLFKIDLLIRKKVFDEYSIGSSSEKGLAIGRNYFLDIEKAGPHGLVVGMTGSGKTVLLQTMILAIAKSYTPTEAVIGIIDFKGDALVNLVKGIPHIASTYSNLDNDYDNVVKSIESEIHYRQIELKNSGFSEYNDERFAKSFPKLFLFIDEFAELKNSSAKIIERLVSIARVGRSLGVYLILSLQKSSGVVCEQLKSNLGYRICLKVNTKQDSNEIINTDAAFYFNKPGQAIVNVGASNIEIQVLNCNDFVKDAIIIDNNNSDEITCFDYEISTLSKRYLQSKYVIWKSFPKHHLPGIVINDPTSKAFFQKYSTFSNYIVIGENEQERLQLVNTIISSLSCIILYLGSDKAFQSSLSFNAINYLEIYLHLAMSSGRDVVFVVDGIDYFVDDKLNEIISKIIDNKYHKVKVIVCAKTVNTSVNRICKRVTEKYLLRHTDSADAYNLFFKRSEIQLSKPDVGVCIHNGNLVTFKNYYQGLMRDDIFKIDLSARYLSLATLQTVAINDSLIIYDDLNLDIDAKVLDSLDSLNSIDGNYLIHYSKVTNQHLVILQKFSRVLIATNKFELNFRKFPVYDKMFYDLLANEHIIVTKHLDCY